MSVHPTEIKLHQQSRVLEITFGDDTNYLLPYEFLRVYSPSAEVRGHGVGQGTLQVGKQNVGVLEVLPVGSYAMKIVFDDGHDSGLYSWDLRPSSLERISINLFTAVPLLNFTPILTSREVIIVPSLFMMLQWKLWMTATCQWRK